MARLGSRTDPDPAARGAAGTPPRTVMPPALAGISGRGRDCGSAFAVAGDLPYMGHHGLALTRSMPRLPARRSVPDASIHRAFPFRRPPGSDDQGGRRTSVSGSSRPGDGEGHPSPDLTGPAVRSTRQRWQDVVAPLQEAERAEVRAFERTSRQRALAEGPGTCRGMSVARKLCGAGTGIGFRVQSEPEPAGSRRGAPVVDEERESL